MGQDKKETAPSRNDTDEGETSAPPENRSVRDVEPLVSWRGARALGRIFYDDPDSETTLYRVPPLNRSFAVASLLLLFAVVLAIWKDHDRQWKRVQADWQEELLETHRREIEEARAASAERFATLGATLSEVAHEIGLDELPRLRGSAADGSAVGQLERRVERLLARVEKALNDEPRTAELAADYRLLARKRQRQQKEVRYLESELQAARFRHERERKRLLDRSGDTPATAESLHAIEERFRTEHIEPLAAARRALEQLERAAEKARRDYEEHLSNAVRVPLDGKERSVSELRDAYELARQPLEEARRKIRELESDWRDAPLVDFLAPTYRVQKVILEDLPEDLHFVTVPRVDRCKTCHLNIDEPSGRFWNTTSRRWGTVYRSHPRMDLYVSPSSPHPYERFGCTTCHGGDGRALSFASAAHTPSSPDQGRVWAERFDWHELEHEETPMLPREHVFSSCGKCHPDEQQVPGGGAYNEGREIVARYGCYGCHSIPGFPLHTTGRDRSLSFDKRGGNLGAIASKVDLAFLYHWIRAPTRFRPSTRMPSFFDNTNNHGTMQVEGADGRFEVLDFDVRNRLEALALASYLIATSTVREIPPAPSGGVAARGRELFGSETLGCVGCHSVVAERQQSVEEEPEWEKVSAELARAREAEGVAAGRLAPAYRRVEETLGEFVQWTEVLHGRQDAEGLFHGVQHALERASSLEEEAGRETRLESARLLAAALRDRWVHATFAADLSRVGSKFRRDVDSLRRAKAWLVDWVLDPARHDPRTVMPRFRLDADAGGKESAADIAAYLLSLRDEAFEDDLRERTPNPDALTEAEREVLDGIVFYYLRSDHAAHEARDALTQISDREKLVYAGHRLVRRYACYACHDGIADAIHDPITAPYGGQRGDDARTFDRAQRIGPDLSGFGAKSSELLDFGMWGYQPQSERWAIAPNRYAWAKAKLEAPRRFDVIPVEKNVGPGAYTYELTDRLVHKTPDALARMPRFPFYDDPRAVSSVVTFLGSLAPSPVPSSRKRHLEKTALALESGSRLIEKLNCAGCHRLGARPQIRSIDSLPLCSISDPRPEEIRQSEWEAETWLAEGVTLRARPRGKRSSEGGAAGGLPLPAGMLLGQQVLDPTSMDPQIDEPMSLVELAYRHYRPVPGFIQDVLRVWDPYLSEEDPRDEQLESFLRRVENDAEDPLSEFVRSLRDDYKAGASERARFLETLSQVPYAEPPESWPPVVRNDLPRFRELAEQYHGQDLHAGPADADVLWIQGFREGPIRYYFGTSSAARSNAPPPLIRHGERVRGQWLLEYLLNVERIRPWLRVRMPSYQLSDEEARTLVDWFRAVAGLSSGPEVFAEDRCVEDLARLGRELFVPDPAPGQSIRPELLEEFDLPATTSRKACSQCHPSTEGLPTLPVLDGAADLHPRDVPIAAPSDSFFLVWRTESGNVSFEGGFPDQESAIVEGRRRFGQPTTSWAVGSPWDKAKWGPDLRRAADRLRPQWIERWLRSPPKFVPSTAMPSFFASREWYAGPAQATRAGDPPGAEDSVARQIDALVQFILHMNSRTWRQSTPDGAR